MDVRVGPQRRLSTKELMLLNCGVGEDSWESLGQQGDQTSPFWRKLVLNIHWKDLMLKLKLQYFGHLMWRVNSLEKTLMLGKTEGGRRGVWQRMRWLDGITDSMDIKFEQAPGDGEGQKSLTYCSSWGCKELNMTEQLNSNNKKPEKRLHILK